MKKEDPLDAAIARKTAALKQMEAAMGGLLLSTNKNGDRVNYSAGYQPVDGHSAVNSLAAVIKAGIDKKLSRLIAAALPQKLSFWKKVLIVHLTKKGIYRFFKYQ